jgi:predicted nucleotidyltransferase
MHRLETYKKQIMEVIEKYLPKSKVYLFGSRARGTNLEGADIDIALDAGAPIDLKLLFAITNALEDSKIPVYIDVVDLYTVSQDLKEQILKDKIVWKN